ncbi:phosphoribosyl-AMP cyclohydrolase [Pelagibacteraceae bacterium]|nr:phosphoribosyl-AMP cyclohydrolase [Pelagibacteraceae bacterium]
MFKDRKSIEQVEESNELAPKFDENGLIVVTTIDSQSNEILMVGYMNHEALKKTIVTKEAHYFSRSRNMIWHKGASSGYVQKIDEILIDDDQDALCIKVNIGENGASCHVGYKSCFYRKIDLEDTANKEGLEFTTEEKVFDPNVVYGDAPNPTKL